MATYDQIPEQGCASPNPARARQWPLTVSAASHTLLWACAGYSVPSGTKYWVYRYAFADQPKWKGNGLEFEEGTEDQQRSRERYWVSKLWVTLKEMVETPETLIEMIRSDLEGGAPDGILNVDVGGDVAPWQEDDTDKFMQGYGQDSNFRTSLP